MNDPNENDGKIWMPLYIGDYLADTIGLSNAQHGAYLRCIMAYWRNAGPLSRQALMEICGREHQRVSQFFILCDNVWHHKRIDEELSEMQQRRQKAKERSLKAVEARRRLGQLPPENL